MSNLACCHEPGLLAVQMRLKHPAYQTAFDEWYNTEHGPARLKINNFLNGYRYKSRDEQPVWFAIYDMDRLSVGAERKYTSLREHRSQREQVVMKTALNVLARRFYKLVSSHGRIPNAASPVLLTTTVVVDDAELLRYDRVYLECLRIVQKYSGWIRSRRFELVDGPGPSAGRHLYLMIHEFDSSSNSWSLCSLVTTLTMLTASVPTATQFEPPRIFDFYHEFLASDYSTPPEPGTSNFSTLVTRSDLTNTRQEIMAR